MFSDWMIDSTYNKKKDGTKFKYTLIGAFIFHGWLEQSSSFL